MKFTHHRTIAILIFFATSHIMLGQEAISAKELHKHVEFLASDLLKGRKPGTPEAKIAAKYIADEFKRFGLRLLGKDGFQYFDVKSGLRLGQNYLKIDDNELVC